MIGQSRNYFFDLLTENVSGRLRGLSQVHTAHQLPTSLLSCPLGVRCALIPFCECPITQTQTAGLIRIGAS